VISNANAQLTLASDWIPGQDYIVQISEPLQSRYVYLNFHGARNIVIVGGEIVISEPQFGSGPSGRGLKAGFPKCTITTTATGGTFRCKPSSSNRVPMGTNDLPYNATAQQILDELASSIGPGHVSASGGPLGTEAIELWANLFDPAMGRLEIDQSRLTGGRMTIVNAGWQDDLGMLRLKDWSGTLYLEGIWMHGAGLGEGINLESGYDNATAILQNCHIAPEFYRYHNDHHHPDGIQAYRGPAVLKAAR
jgi:hypothetical protein